MPLPQKKAREILLLLLYSQDVASSPLDELEQLVMEELKVTKKSVKDVEERLEKIIEYRPTLDLIIKRISTSYDFDRIHDLERNILRLGAYEILYDADIPPKVAITEAIRLANKFTTPQAAQFVNAILDSLYKESIGKPIDHQAILDSSVKLKEEEANRAIPGTGDNQVEREGQS